MSRRLIDIVLTPDFSKRIDEAPSDFPHSDASSIDDSCDDKDYVCSGNEITSGDESEIPTPHQEKWQALRRTFSSLPTDVTACCPLYDNDSEDEEDIGNPDAPIVSTPSSSWAAKPPGIKQCRLREAVSQAVLSTMLAPSPPQPHSSMGGFSTVASTSEDTPLPTT